MRLTFLGWLTVIGIAMVVITVLKAFGDNSSSEKPQGG
jgi:hypothetical protein